MQFREFLTRKEACTPALTWVGDRTAEQAWADCTRPDWMLWLVGRVGDSSIHRPIVRIALECARMIPSDDPRVIFCLTTVDRWLAEEVVDLEAAAQAAEAAWDATWAARVAAEAAGAARAAWAAGDAAESAAGAARVAAEAAWDAGASQVALCAIVRKHLPWSVIGPLIDPR